MWLAYFDQAHSKNQENQYCDIKTKLIKTFDDNGKVISEKNVEVVECNDGTLYTGISTDVAVRVGHHNTSTRGAKYTRSRRPVKLATQFPAGSHSEALKQETAFKKLSRKKKQRSRAPE